MLITLPVLVIFILIPKQDYFEIPPVLNLPTTAYPVVISAGIVLRHSPAQAAAVATAYENLHNHIPLISLGLQGTESHSLSQLLSILKQEICLTEPQSPRLSWPDIQTHESRNRATHLHLASESSPRAYPWCNYYGLVP